LFDCHGPCGGTTSKYTVLTDTYERCCLYAQAKTVQGGDRSNIRPSQDRPTEYWTGQPFTDWAPLTGDKI